MVAKLNQPLIAIVGETASGKSDLATLIAKRFNGEIVNADSWSVYRGFDIGTAKPTLRQRQQIPHHLIDVADPREGFNAARFKDMAEAAIADILSRGKVPILSGGTGLYIDSIIFNYSFLPPGSPSERQEYNKMTIAQLTDLISAKGYSADGIDTRNKRRLVRLLETGGQRPKSQPIREDILVIGMRLPKEQLLQSIIKRTSKMMNGGLEEEVKQLVKKYGWEIEPMKGIGYREFRSYWDNDAVTIDDVAKKIINDSLALAKKQKTWLQRNNSIHWIVNSGEAIDITTTFLNKF